MVDAVGQLAMAALTRRCHCCHCSRYGKAAVALRLLRRGAMGGSVQGSNGSRPGGASVSRHHQCAPTARRADAPSCHCNHCRRSRAAGGGSRHRNAGWRSRSSSVRRAGCGGDSHCDADADAHEAGAEANGHGNKNCAGSGSGTDCLRPPAEPGFPALSNVLALLQLSGLVVGFAGFADSLRNTHPRAQCGEPELRQPGRNQRRYVRRHRLPRGRRKRVQLRRVVFELGLRDLSGRRLGGRRVPGHPHGQQSQWCGGTALLTPAGKISRGVIEEPSPNRLEGFRCGTVRAVSCRSAPAARPGRRCAAGAAAIPRAGCRRRCGS